MFPQSKSIYPILLLVLASLQPLCAQKISNTGVQLYYGPSFSDRPAGLETEDNKILFVNLDNFSTWAYGDNIYYVSFFSGKFLDANQQPTSDRFIAYGEWWPRLSFSKLFKTKISTSDKYAVGIKDVYLAGQLNQGENFQARMLGASVDIKLPLFSFLSLSGYYRYDNFDQEGFQITSLWTIPFFTGTKYELTYLGYIDIHNTRFNGIDVASLSTLNWTVSRLFSKDAQNYVKIGVDFYFHRNDNWVTSTPLFSIRWGW